MSKDKKIELGPQMGKASDLNETINKMKQDPVGASSLSMYGVTTETLASEQKSQMTVIKNDSYTSDIEQYCKTNNIGKEGYKFLTELKQLYR